ncbi:MAG TPA: hypothetical protein VK436_04600 [Methanocella sp.]|nr:hypothetical protein [Methanocella sp.]
MKKVCAIALVLAIISATVDVGGCTDIGNQVSGFTPTPDIVYGPISPIPSPTLAPSPSAVINPTPWVMVINSRLSGKVRLVFAPQDTKVFNWSRDINGQTEKIAMIVVNDDDKPAKNVKVDVFMSDNQGHQLLFQEFTVGDIGKEDYKLAVFSTKYHDDASFAIVDFRVIWGDNDEFYNDRFSKHYLAAYS